MRLAILTTHPIQYYAPVFRLLADEQQLEIKVFFTWGESAIDKLDPGFNRKINWDIPLTEGYPYEWMRNVSSNPGSHHFNGIINPELIDRVEYWKAEALLVYGWAYHSHLKAMRYFKGKIPIYFRGDSTLFDNTNGLRNLLKTIFLKWVYRHIDHAFYVGTNNKAYFKKYGLTDEQLSFAPHTIDNERFGIIDREAAHTFRDKWEVTKDAMVMLFAGKFEKKKSPESLLRAFLELKKPDVYLVFVGDGLLLSSLKEITNGHENVRFMGFQNQSAMPAVYQACDLFCLPSRGPGETWGLAVNEAMACGKPVLVSNLVGCAADLVVPGFTGEIFNSGDDEDLKSKLDLLLSDHGNLQNLGANAAQEISKWNFKVQVSAMINRIKVVN